MCVCGVNAVDFITENVNKSTHDIWSESKINDLMVLGSNMWLCKFYKKSQLRK